MMRKDGSGKRKLADDYTSEMFIVSDEML